MKYALLLLALLALTGCASPAPRPAEPARAAEPLLDKRVTVDPALRDVLRVIRVRDMPATQGYLKFQVDVQNLSSAAKTIIYEVDWLNEDGGSLGLATEAPPCTLFRGETLPIAITAPTPAARDFRITFRPRGH
jgi:uncharacterized protein YcfL